jgi:activator of HSP90 ATPase
LLGLRRFQGYAGPLYFILLSLNYYYLIRDLLSGTDIPVRHFKNLFMSKTLIQKIVFKGIPVTTLYNTYTDSKEHSNAIGIPVTIRKKEGTLFKSHDGYIAGKIFQLVKNKLVVQSWRGSDWDPSAIDSTFILSFEQKGKDGIVHMVHANIPDANLAGIRDGWNTYYWKPWKNYFSSKKKK